jgi:glycosyltransferase involved in cell wall biosynthesis
LRLGILATHPIQYQAPWFRHLAQRFDLQVFFAHQQDAAGQAAAGFDVPFQWDVPLLEGYNYRWLQNVARFPSVSGFRGCDTPELATVIAADRFDGFLICGWNKKCFLQAVWACRRQSVPVLIRGDSQLPTWRPKWKTAAKYLPYRWFLQRIDAHLYVGERNRAYLRHYGVPDERLFFCPHCVDAEFFAAGASTAAAHGSRERIRRELAIPPHAFVFLFVGRFVARKRPEDFLGAFQLALDSSGRTDLYAILVGDGPLRTTLEQTAAPRVRFAGFRNQSELPSYYHAADALVLPSDASETWGLVVNEASVCGRPALVSDAAGCGPDLVHDGATGFTFPLGDTTALAERMLALCELIERQSDHVRESLAAKTHCYSLTTATDGLEAALESVCGRRRRRMEQVGTPAASAAVQA